MTQPTYSQEEYESEEWKDIPGWTGEYQASSLGRIRSLDREITYPNGKLFSRKGKILSGSVNNSGYRAVSLFRNQTEKRFTVHSLVLMAFVGPRQGGMQACHWDGNRLNNRLSNLRWDTVESNHADKKRHGTNRVSRKTHCKDGHELSEDNVLIVRPKNGYPYRRCKVCQSKKRKEHYFRDIESSREYARNYYKEKYAVPEDEKKQSICEKYAAQTHCKRGHILEQPNLTPHSVRAGHRACRACANGTAYFKRHPNEGRSVQEISDAYYEKIMKDVVKRH